MINRAAIQHRTSDSFCYALNDKEVVINIKTGKEVKEVKIIQGDPFAWGILGGNHAWTGSEEALIYNIELENHLLWKITLKPKYKRLKYYFIISSENEQLAYFEDGFKNYQNFLNDSQFSSASIQGFTFPWINRTDIFQTPNWVNDTCWYQIFPDRFNNGDSSINSENVKKWKKGKVNNREEYGGDLQGVYDKLEYLHDLGINGIYFTPLFSAKSIHKYDTTDYFKIDPSFGDVQLFKKVVSRAHELGIKIMIDCVFNHCGPDYAPWLDVVEKGQKSEYFDWFMVNKWPIPELRDTKGKEYFSFAYAQYMPKLNTNNVEVQKMFLKMCDFWIDNCDIDAIRIDVANETAHSFNKALRRHVKQKNKDIFILGEIWHDSMEWLRGDEFDSVMNYPVMSEFNKLWFDNSVTNKEFMFNMNRIFTMYPNQATNVLFNLLDSHDTDRIITRFGNRDIVLQQLLLLFALPGSPCIYYGTEVLLEGSHDPDCRRCMPWDQIENGDFCELTNEIKKIIRLRKDNCEMRSLYYTFDIVDNHRVIIMNKFNNENMIKIYINLSQTDYNIEIDEHDEMLLTHNCIDNKICINGYAVIKKGKYVL